MWWPLSITLVKGTRATFITVLTTGAILKVFFRDNLQILCSVYSFSTLAKCQLTIPSLCHAESYRDFGKLGHSLHTRVADKFRLELIQRTPYFASIITSSVPIFCISYTIIAFFCHSVDQLTGTVPIWTGTASWTVCIARTV